MLLRLLRAVLAGIITVAMLGGCFPTKKNVFGRILADADAQAALKQLKALDALVVGGKLETDAMPAAKVAAAYAKDPLGVGRAHRNRSSSTASRSSA